MKKSDIEIQAIVNGVSQKEFIEDKFNYDVLKFVEKTLFLEKRPLIAFFFVSLHLEI